MKNVGYGLLLLAISAVVASGCANQDKQSSPHYQTVVPEPGKNTELALKHNETAAQLIDKKDWCEAEKHLRLALAADDACGPAHNNLGKVYYEQKKMYLAAIEFQTAGKLMPTIAAPRNNLGLVYESAGQYEKASASYEEAMRLQPREMESTANLARVYLRMNRKDQRTRDLLNDVASHDSRPQWKNWAQTKLAVMAPETQATSGPMMSPTTNAQER